MLFDASELCGLAARLLLKKLVEGLRFAPSLYMLSPSADHATDRNPSTDRIAYPPDARSVVNVTEAPYFADKTGKQDCTAILVRILDELLGESQVGMREVMDILSAEPAEDWVMPGSFENRKQAGEIFGVFPKNGPSSKIIYFPKGTYLVSDTICYSFDDLKNGLGVEMNWCIRLQGENQHETIIRLQDGSRGFEHGMARPMISYIRGRSSNIAMSNFMRNLTIDIGARNPGAIGVEFMGNNCAGMEAVTIRSSDEKRRGYAGLSMSRNGISGCVFNHVSIEGFDYGVAFTSRQGYVVFEKLALRNQALRGFSMEGNSVATIYGLSSTNRLPALTLVSSDAHLIVLDALLNGGANNAPAIEVLSGHVFLRNIRSTGYGCVLGMAYSPGWGTDPLIPGDQVDEYVSDPVCVLNPAEFKRSLHLPIVDAPIPGWELDFGNWVHPGVFGAVGDGVTDDTLAIQRAMDSGKPVIYFQPGRYRIDSPIQVPPSVKQVNFMFVDLVSGKALQDMEGMGMFTVTGDCSDPLLIEDLFSFEQNFGHHYLIDHGSTRTLILRNLHAQCCAAYINSQSGGTVFIENFISTTGIFNNSYQQPCFVFRGQKAWCKQLDPEYTLNKVLNDGSLLVVLGFKTEGHGSAFIALNGAQMEILGGIVYFGTNDDLPILINDHSDVAFVASTTGTTSRHLFKIAVRELADGFSVDALHHQFPKRLRDQYTIPLYVGRRSKVSG